MNRKVLKSIVAASCLAVVGLVACEKNNDSSTKDVWEVHNYCVPLRPDVYCAQNDTLQETYPHDKYKQGQTIIVSQDANIIYYKYFITLVGQQ
ncbi:hypothetical protein [Taibaiella soli]|uniref:Uncharacterized protein n=1 Tax=Taibaiella soli TaxID=1649169 RepID=A0A2W2B670_9BACT|nr:hypothetical protein [Taibaiella soli]PZF71477.1 hypothetical protein DN068_18085 [Taibaiella soli]